MADILSTFSTRQTPQNTPARSDQIANAAGGFTFEAQNRIDRFLTLGTTGGTYYTKAAELTRDNAGFLVQALEEDPIPVVASIVDISTQGRAPKQQPAIFALAAASAFGTDESKRMAMNYIPAVCRTGAMLFDYVRYVEQFRGWGPALTKAVARWYTEMPLDKLTYQAVKYRQREGVSHADVLRLAHPSTVEAARDRLFNWITRNDAVRMSGGGKRGNELPVLGPIEAGLPRLVTGFEDIQAAPSVIHAANIIADVDGITWEMIPDRFINEPMIWEALMDKGIPMTALMRQLPRLTRIGLVTDNLGSPFTIAVLKQLRSDDRIRRARIHPINVLVALRTYATGVSRGGLTHTPARKVLDALDAMFYKAYGNVEPSNKATLLACDVSGSMTAPVSGLPLTCREATAAIALVTANVEPQYQMVGFTSGQMLYRAHGPDAGLSKLSISPRQRLDDVMRYMDDLPFGRTDCAAPMVWAANHKVPVETFQILTDNETWYGPVHPHQALEQYRQKMSIDSKLVVVAMTANGNSIADPTDPRQMDVSGFDSAVPQLISDFSGGRL